MYMKPTYHKLPIFFALIIFCYIDIETRHTREYNVYIEMSILVGMYI